MGLRFHSRDDILVCVDSSSAFRLLDVQKRRLAACHDGVEFPQVPSGKGAWGGEGHVRPMCGIAFNPQDPLHSMLLFNHRYLEMRCRDLGAYDGSGSLDEAGGCDVFFFVSFVVLMGGAVQECGCLTSRLRHALHRAERCTWTTVLLLG